MITGIAEEIPFSEAKKEKVTGINSLPFIDECRKHLKIITRYPPSAHEKPTESGRNPKESLATHPSG